MTGEDAYIMVRGATRAALAELEPRQLLVTKGKSGMLCIMPRKYAAGASADKSTAVGISGDMLLATAEFLVDTSTFSLETSAAAQDALIVASLFEGAMQTRCLQAWSLELQVGWLRLAATALPLLEMDTLKAGSSALLTSLEKQPPSKMVTHAAVCFKALPALAAKATRVEVASFATALVSVVRREHFRLRIHEASAVLDNCCKLLTLLPKDNAVQLRDNVERLAATALAGLPAKFNSERVFHGKHGDGVKEEDVLLWCELMTRIPDAITISNAVLNNIWKHLAGEVVLVINRGEPDETTVAILRAFVSESHRRGWDAKDVSSPLGAVAEVVAVEWKRAIVRDGELEDAMHEPLPIPDAAEAELLSLFSQIGLKAPSIYPETTV